MSYDLRVDARKLTDSGLQYEHVLDLLLLLDTITGRSPVGLVQDIIESPEPQSEDGRGQEQDPGGWTPDSGASAVVGELSRHELAGAVDPPVTLFPSREGGIPFLEGKNAWRFVRIGQHPEYAGMYITGDVGAVMYVARVKEIVPASEATVSRPLASATGDQTKRGGVLEPESSYELSNPIPLKTCVPYGLR